MITHLKGSWPALMHRSAAFLSLVALVFALASCGSSSNPSAGSTGATSDQHNEAATAVNGTSAEGGECPLTEDQVSEAVGETTPLVPGPATSQVICTFAQTTSKGVDLEKPGLTVAPFPLPGQTTLAALRSELEGGGETVLDRPQWGEHAFMTMIEPPKSTSVQVDLFLPTQHILILSPPGIIKDPVRTGDQIGTALGTG